MDIKLAKYIKELRTGNPSRSWRRVAEIIIKEYPDFIEKDYGKDSLIDLYGNQLLGQELCEEAMEVLGESKEDWGEL